jgi:hypothetical protein
VQRPLVLNVIFIAIFVALSSCGSNESEPTSTPLPTETPVPLPTMTATPATPLVILVLPTDMDPATYDLYQSAVYDLAQQEGYRFQLRNSLSEADLEPMLRIVIAFPPDPGPGITVLASAAPQTQFLAINIPGVIAGGNMSVLANSMPSDVVAFMAGSMGAMITEDYRIGMIIPKDDPDALRALDAYTNGMVYFCGICRGYYYLPYTFPQYIEIPAEEDPANYGGYAVYLIQQREVDFIYLYPELTSPELLAYIGSLGAVQAGSTPQGGIPLYWAASFQSDLVGAIRSAWPNLVASQGGQEILAPLKLGDVDSTLLSAGKQLQVEQVLADLLAGRINPYTIP